MSKSRSIFTTPGGLAGHGGYTIDMTGAEQTARRIRRRFRRRKRGARAQKREAMQGRGLTPQIEEELLLATRETWMQLLRKRSAEDQRTGDPRTVCVAPTEDLREGHFLREVSQTSDRIGTAIQTVVT